MVIEEKIVIEATPDEVFAVYSDVSNWNVWDPDTKSSSINGAFETGAKGRITPAKGQAINLVFSSVIKNKSFTCEGGVPFFKMVFEHELNRQGAGTVAIHRVTMTGALTFLIGRMVREQLKVGLPKTMFSLKRLIESKK
jgi:Polyketide cyclase / dehydrase and lipid transport